MTTMTTNSAPAAQAPAGAGARRERVTFVGLLRSEWIKFWTVRSSIWTLSITAFVIVSLVLLTSLAFVNDPTGESTGETDPSSTYAVAVYFAVLAVAVLGALVITGEYSTGMIRSSFTAAPRRLPVLWSKAIVLAVSVLLVTGVSLAVAAALQWALYHDKGFYVDASDPQQLRALFGGALYVTGIALLSFAAGTLLRNSAAAIATVLGVLLVLPIVFSLVPWHPLQEILPFLPSQAGMQVMATDDVIQAQREGSDATVLTAWQGFGVLLAYVAALLVPAAILVKKRDA